jgi:hypothetical protein
MKWSQAASLPGAIQIPASAVWGGYIYAFGNYGHYYKYEIATDTWSSFTGPPSGHGYAAEAVTVKDEIYLIGGNSGYIYEAYQTTEIFDPVTETWTTGPDLNVGRYQFGAVYVGSESTIYACAGRDATASSIASVEMLTFQGFTLSVSPKPLVAGQTGSFTVTNGDANTYTFLGYSLVGPGSVYVKWLNVTVGLASPKQGAGPTLTNNQGGLVWTLKVPNGAAGRKIWLQAVQYGKASNVVATSIQ